MHKGNDPMARELHSRRSLLAGTALAGVAMALGGGALANPANPTVVHGVAGFTSSGSVLEVTQGTDKAIIDWRGFDIAAGETTRFVQPGSGSIALNRVGGTTASAINGSLTSNGRIFLINPNGILFGAGSNVDVGALVATTADVANDRFLAGDYRFDMASTVAGATIANSGTIKAGMAALVAPQVRNSGTIQASLGSATLGAAQRFTLDLAGDGLISFDASSAIDGARLQQAGLVQGTRVLLSAATAARVVDSVIDMTGVVEARTVRQDGSDIVLDGGQGGVAVAGTLNTNGGGVRIAGSQATVTAGLTVNGSLSATAGTISVASGATVNSSGAQTYTGDLSLAGNLVGTQSGAITVTGGVSVGELSTIVTGGNAGDAITLGTVNGPGFLTLDAGNGAVSLGRVGSSRALAGLSTKGSAVALSGVATTGQQDYTGAVTLSGDLVSHVGGAIRVAGPMTLTSDSTVVTAGSAGDDIAMTGAVNGPYALQLDAGSGRVTLGGAVGGTRALKLLAAGGSRVSLGNVTTTGLQDYAGAVTLNGALVSTVGGAIRVEGPLALTGDSTVVTAGSGGDDIAFTGAVNGPYALQLDAGSGRVTLGGAVGAVSALKLLAAGGSRVSLGDVTTTGLQDYAGAVTLNGALVSTVGGAIRIAGDASLTGNSAIVTAGKDGDNIRIGGTINGGSGLLLDAGQGAVSLAGSVGARQALSLLSIGGRTISLRDVTTTGQQDYAGAITLSGDLVSTVGGAIRLGGPVTLAGSSAIVTAGYASDSIRLGGTVNGAYSLLVDAGAATVSAGGAIGASRALTLFSVAGSRVTLGDVTTTGRQDYAGALSLGGNLVSTAGGAVRIAGPVTLTGDSTIVTAGFAGDDINLTASVDGAYALTLDAGAGRVGVAGTVGTTNALKLFAAGGSSISLRNVRTTGLQDYAGAVTLNGDLVSLTGGAIRVAGPLTLAGDSTIVTAGNGNDDIRLTGTVDGAYTLLVDAGRSGVRIGGAVGATSALKLLSVGGSTLSLRGVRTTGLQDYAGAITLNGDLSSNMGGNIRLGGPVTLAADSTITTAGAAADGVNFTGALAGPYRLNVRAGAGAVGLVGAVTGLTGLDVKGGRIDAAAPLTVAGALALDGGRLTTAGLTATAVTLKASDDLTTGALTATQDVGVTGAKAVTLGPVAARTLTASAGGEMRLSAVTAPNVSLTGTDALTTGAVSATQDVTITGGKAVTLGTVTARNLTASAGTNLRLAGVTAEAATLSGTSSIASTSPLTLSRTLLLSTSGTATGLDVRTGALTYRGTGRFNASGSVAGVSGQDAADLIQVAGDRSGTYLFADRPVFGVAALADRHRLDIAPAPTTPAGDGDVRNGPLVLDPGAEKDELITFRD
jgi:filamentous hemagglutinin family protein